jgi:hypothetical protein
MRCRRGDVTAEEAIKHADHLPKKVLAELPAEQQYPRALQLHAAAGMQQALQQLA